MYQVANRYVPQEVPSRDKYKSDGTYNKPKEYDSQKYHNGMDGTLVKTEDLNTHTYKKECFPKIPSEMPDYYMNNNNKLNIYV